VEEETPANKTSLLLVVYEQFTMQQQFKNKPQALMHTKTVKKKTIHILRVQNIGRRKNGTNPYQ